MKIFPAIDIIGGKAVRLLQGDYNNITIYSDNPVATADGFRRAGAKYIHLVDLEGARDGEPRNFELIKRIIKGSGLQAEVGGGIRTYETASRYLNAGAMRVILGTAALEEPELLKRLIADFGTSRVAVGADIRNGFVAIKGWTETSALSCNDFLERLSSVGIQTVICTDISRDGAMKGTNLSLYRELQRKYSMDIVASGGISRMKDVEDLIRMDISAAILGRAIYTKDIDLKEACLAAKN